MLPCVACPWSVPLTVELACGDSWPDRALVGLAGKAGNEVGGGYLEGGSSMASRPVMGRPMVDPARFSLPLCRIVPQV